MSDHDRLDRIERKLKRIGKYVLFGVALFTVLLAVEMQNMSSDIFFGYGRFALWSFVGVMTVMRLVARAPFRDWARIRLGRHLWREFSRTPQTSIFFCCNLVRKRAGCSAECPAGRRHRS